MAPEADPSRPVVSLSQGTVIGVTLQNEHLPRPVEAFLGIPYAQPPVGDRRFRRAEKVPASSQVIDASQYGPAAPGKQVLQIGGPFEYSEDCLTVNVFRHVPSDAGDAGKQPLPVLVYIHGGAFNRATARMHNTASMVSFSEHSFVAVSFNYRLGALGFLPCSLSAKKGCLNLGLRDQILLLEWVQENIGQFGGDTGNVTLGGLSAGAHSIGHHMMNYKEGQPPLFHRAIIESGAPTSRAVRPYDADIHEQQFRDFLHETGCPTNLPEDEVFPYLRGQPLGKIVNASITVFDKYNPSLRWAFQPVIDGDTIPRPSLETWRSGKWHRVPIMTGFNRNEGSMYVDHSMGESSQFRHFFEELLPLLSAADLDTIVKLYPDPLAVPGSPYKDTRDGVGPQYKRIEAAYGQYAYVAPVRQTAEFASAAQAPPVYLYQWALQSTVVDGAKHGDNILYEVCDPAVRKLSPALEELAGTMNAYMTSFIAKGDPNAATSRFGGRPAWLPYRAEDPKAMVFGEENKQLVGGGPDSAGVPCKFEEDEWAREECKFWWSKVDVSQQ